MIFDGFNFNIKIDLGLDHGARDEMVALKKQGYRVVACPGNMFIVLLPEVDTCVGYFVNTTYSDSIAGRWWFYTGSRATHREVFDIVRTTFNQRKEGEKRCETVPKDTNQGPVPN